MSSLYGHNIAQKDYLGLDGCYECGGDIPKGAWYWDNDEEMLCEDCGDARMTRAELLYDASKE